MTEPLGTEYHDDEWEHGLRCAECHHLFRESERYAERLESFTGDTPIVLIVCVVCALGDSP